MVWLVFTGKVIKLLNVHGRKGHPVWHPLLATGMEQTGTLTNKTFNTGIDFTDSTEMSCFVLVTTVVDVAMLV